MATGRVHLVITKLAAPGQTLKHSLLEPVPPDMAFAGLVTELTEIGQQQLPNQRQYADS